MLDAAEVALEIRSTLGGSSAYGKHYPSVLLISRATSAGTHPFSAGCREEALWMVTAMSRP